MVSPFWTVQDVADYLDVHAKTIYRNIHKIPGAFKPPGVNRWYIDPDVFKERLKNLAKQPARLDMSSGGRHNLI